MKRFNTQTTRLSELRRAFDRRLQGVSSAVEETVRAILARVSAEGDAAVLEYTRQLDFPGAVCLRVPEAALLAAETRIRATPLWEVLERAAVRIRRFHQQQRQNSWWDTSVPGEILGQRIQPLQRVGIYVPGGSAAYPSTVLMTAVPAAVAGVGEIALATPPHRETGLPPDATLAACRVAGVTEVYAMGGAQAIAALAYGTDEVAAVDKIVGPGSLYANLAKRLVFGTVGIDSLAGPSEVAVLADGAADAAMVAADLIAQCEHDPVNSALLATPDPALMAAVLAEIEKQCEDLPRAGIVQRALSEYGFAVQTRDLEEAVEVISLYAPEHLHLDVAEPWGILPKIAHAGAILIGKHSTAALGDYIAGPSHTLPTAGGARFGSPLSVDDFIKKSSVIYFDAAAAASLAGDAAILASFEGLEGHARAARRAGT